MRLVSNILAAAAKFSVSVASSACAPPTHPVVVGGDADRDACDTWATVAPLNPKGDGYLTVRFGPTVKATEMDRLKSGHPVMICNDSKDGKWAGVVYPADHAGDLADCGLSSPDARPSHPYDGPCKSGWVARRYLWLSAG